MSREYHGAGVVAASMRNIIDVDSSRLKKGVGGLVLHDANRRSERRRRPPVLLGRLRSHA
jgi:hypothetical protein